MVPDQWKILQGGAQTPSAYYDMGQIGNIDWGRWQDGAFGRGVGVGDIDGAADVDGGRGGRFRWVGIWMEGWGV